MRTLRRLRINRVDLVERGANFDRNTGDGAHIVLFKSAGDDAHRDGHEDKSMNIDALIHIAKCQNPSLSHDDAVAKAMNERPEAYERYRRGAYAGRGRPRSGRARHELESEIGAEKLRRVLANNLDPDEAETLFAAHPDAYLLRLDSLDSDRAYGQARFTVI